MLSRYAAFERLGQGGMGVVYRATDNQLQRAVALKFVTARFGSEEQARARFLREARTAAALNHPAICTIYEVGETQPGEENRLGPDQPLAAGTPFIAMELIEGQPLDEVLRSRGRLALDPLLETAIPIAEALAAAHAKGIVHRDLKPANVMVTPDGRPKILDFGLAKVVEAHGEQTQTAAETESAALTQQGQVLGTVAYMSPEQAQGKTVDSRSDIFSFGVMLYEMAAGERPFRGDTPTSTLAKILETEPKPLGDIRSDLPGELLRIVRRCLRKKPEERFQSTGDLAVALRELRQETGSGPTKGWSDAAFSPARSTRRNVLFAVVAIVVMAAAIGASWLASRRTASKPGPTLRQITSNPSDTSVYDAAISPDGKFLAFADPTGTYLRVIDTGETHKIVTHEDLDVFLLAWSPDGTRLAVTATDETTGGYGAWSLSILGGPPRKLRDDAWIGDFSPDGSMISFVSFAFRGRTWSAKGLWVMGSDGEDAKQVAPLGPDDIFLSSGSWSADGARLVFVRVGSRSGTDTGSLEVVDRNGGPAKVLLSDPRLFVPSGLGVYCTWMRDGRIVYNLGQSGSVGVSADLWQLQADPRTGAVKGEPKHLWSLADSMALHPSATKDGKRLAFVKYKYQSDVFVGELHEGGTRLDNVRRLTLDDRNDNLSGWSRDSRSVYFTSERQGTADIFRQGVGDTIAEPVVQGPGAQRGAELSPDGSYLLYVSPSENSDPPVYRIMRMPVVGGPPVPIFEPRPLVGFDCPRSPTASCILVDDVDKKISFRVLDPLKGVGRLIGEAATTLHVWSISPDGSRIAFVASGDTGDLKVMTMKMTDGTTMEMPAKDLFVPFDLSWSADNQSLFAIDGSGKESRVLRIDRDSRVSVLRRSTSRFSSFRGSLQSPDGKLLAFEAWTTDSNAWLLENP